MDSDLTQTMENLSELNLNEPSPAEQVSGIPLLMDRILKDVPSPDLFSLRPVSHAWNDAALRLLNKRNDFTVHFCSTSLLKNDPCCFEDEDRKFLLRDVTLAFCDCGNKQKEEVMEKLHLFFQQHHQHIRTMRVWESGAIGGFFSELWNRWELPQLEKLALARLVLSEVPPPLAEKPSVTVLSLTQEDDLAYQLGNRLIAATPNLQQLRLWTDKIPDLSLLATKSLRVLDVDKPRSGWPLRDQTVEDALGIVKTFLHLHGDGLEVLGLNFQDFTTNRSDLVLESPLSKLETLSIFPPAVLKTFGPATFPALKDLKLSLNNLDDNLPDGNERFEFLTDLFVFEAGVNTNRKLEKLLSLCETAETVEVLPSGILPAGHSDMVNNTFLNSMTYNYKNLRKLKICIGFDVDVDEEGIEACTNIEAIEEQLKKIKRLASKGLEDLTLRIIRVQNWEGYFYLVGDWGLSFAADLLDLAKRLKHIYVWGNYTLPLFSPDLKDSMRQVIADNSLPLQVEWRGEEDPDV